MEKLVTQALIKKVVTRPFYCPEHRNHLRAKYYIAFGGTRQLLFPYVIEMRIIRNITPHIISYEDGKHNIIVSCGIVGCGIEMKNIKDIREGITIMEAHYFLFDKKNFDALINFKNTGYELSRDKRQ